MSASVSGLFSQVIPDDVHTHVKISIIGVGKVGMAVSFSILLQGIVSELALVDTQKDKLLGEMMDLQHGQAFLRTIKIQADTDFSITRGSKICVVTAGAKIKHGETEEQLLEKNINVFKSIIPNIIKYSPDCTLIIVSNPVDILTWVAWKLSGLPRHRVLGSGTMLDSSRFRFLLSEKIGIAPKSCHGYIIGELGDHSVPVWSSVNIAGTRLKDLHPLTGEINDPENWSEVHKNVINSASETVSLKGYTSWSIGIMISTLVNSILKNQKIIYALTTLAQGYHGIKEEVFLSLPCVIGEKGIAAVFNQNLSQDEIEKLKICAHNQFKIIEKIKI
ncbi:hypothetical protein HELRODRAFT_156879 [Helobdella robusta]|uniref:L-lactate dehydrogenase n=1 Tax=Helobdella robusta TaxID=6412 RepID=T1EM25_HELRO|nr:hypothetical protein HELRODRAFT_156879 [Helobdella robusta]ESO05340.1 hypothetical protein HELRODRAFT_156879 [Helobdella robusta]